MKNTLKYFVFGAAALCAPGYILSAQDARDNSNPPPPPSDFQPGTAQCQDQVPCCGQPPCGGRGDKARGMWHMQGAQGPQGPQFGPDGQMGGGPGFEAAIPAEIKARLDDLRKDSDQLLDLWGKAVITRGDKAVSQLREDFKKANADLIAKVRKSHEVMREDLRALREGFDTPKCAGEYSGTDAAGGLVFMPDEKTKAAMDNEIVAQINALKAPLTAEAFVKIQQDVISKHKDEIQRKFDEVHMDRQGDPGMMPPMSPMMAPELARMRDAMGNTRNGLWENRREFRSQLREAMKIQDPAKREAAVKKILDDGPDAGPDGKAPAECPKGATGN